MGNGSGVCGMDLAVVVTTATEMNEVVVGEVLYERAELWLWAEEVLADVGAASDDVLLELAVDGRVHLPNQVPAGIMTAGDVLPHQKAGKVQVLGVFGAKRSPLLPEVPTFMEQGFRIDTGDAWTGMWAPAKTPKATLDRLQNALKYVLELPEVREALISKATLNPDFRPAAEMDQIQRHELAYWGPIIKATGFTPDQ